MASDKVSYTKAYRTIGPVKLDIDFWELSDLLQDGLPSHDEYRRCAAIMLSYIGVPFPHAGLLISALMAEGIDNSYVHQLTGNREEDENNKVPAFRIVKA